MGSAGGIAKARGWKAVTPDEHGDWLGQRDKSFDAYLPIGDKTGAEPSLFSNFSLGVSTNRDAWVYNSSREDVAKNMRAMIAFYDAELARFNTAYANSDSKQREAVVNDFVDNDPSKISWTRALKGDLVKNKRFAFHEAALDPGIYRPFTRQWLYFDRSFNEVISQMPRIFPIGKDLQNRVIQVSGIGARSGFSSLMSDAVVNLHTIDTGQCFPRFLYEEAAQPREGELALGEAAEGGLVKRDAITDAGLAHFQAAFPGEEITKDDLFYYVYGLLHSPEYREHFADNLSKQLPRIPAVKKAADFWAFVEAGRKLGDLHCDFDNAEPYLVTIAQGDLRLASIPDPERYFRVEKMKFAGKRPAVDKTTVIYNSNITITGIPLEAYDYVVNGKAALDWVMERQCVRVDKVSGIVNDANRYAIETMGDPAYPLKLFQRVITISMETIDIVRALPKLEID